MLTNFSLARRTNRHAAHCSAGKSSKFVIRQTTHLCSSTLLNRVDGPLDAALWGEQWQLRLSGRQTQQNKFTSNPIRVTYGIQCYNSVENMSRNFTSQGVISVEACNKVTNECLIDSNNGHSVILCNIHTYIQTFYL